MSKQTEQSDKGNRQEQIRGHWHNPFRMRVDWGSMAQSIVLTGDLRKRLKQLRARLFCIHSFGCFCLVVSDVLRLSPPLSPLK